MLVDYKDLSVVKKSVAVEIPAPVIEQELTRVTNEFARQARIPGFRPGKVPVNVVRTRFLKEIDDEVTQRLLPRFFHEAVQEKGLEAVGNPELKSVGAIVEGAPLRFDAEFEVKPPVELAEYRGLEVTDKPVAVSEEEIDRTMQRFLDQNATFRSITDRAVNDGDYAIIDIVSSGDDIETRRSEGYHTHVGEGAPLPELKDALVGMNIGETKSFTKTYEDDAPNENVRGKSVNYEVTVKEIQEREVPELNDDLVKSQGLGETVEEFRQKIAEDMKHHREHEVAQAKKQQIGEKLVELHDSLEVPETLVEEEIGKSLRNYARFLSSQGIDLENAQMDWEKMRDEFRPEAVKQVKRQLVLEAIAKKEGLVVDDSEVDAEIRRAAGNTREFAEVKHRLMHDGSYDSLRLSMLQEKALDLALGESKAVPA